MITEEQLKIVNDLNERRWEIKTIISSFDWSFAPCSVGLVNSATNDGDLTKVNKRNDFLHDKLGHVVSDLNKIIIDKLNCELEEIESEISKYITLSE